jgi:hypothetical protein
MQRFGGNATLANSDEGGAMARLTFLRAAPAVQAARAGKPVNT